jgi:5-methyltetrahydrofolate--homocysteine methyltransferase
MDSTQGLVSTGITIPVIAKGYCGIPQYVDGAIHFQGSPALMAQYAVFARDAGATIIGGCCLTTPEHIAAMVEALKKQPKRTLDEEAMQTSLAEPWQALASRGESSPTGSRGRSPRRQA